MRKHHLLFLLSCQTAFFSPILLASIASFPHGCSSSIVSPGYFYRGGGSTTTTTTRRTTTNKTTQPQRQQQRQRQPCRIFLWDFLSAGKYHLCRRLLRDRLYEGIGGKKFVRIKPNSILEHLYPCSRHKPDVCMICKRTFRDHLERWWESHKGSPYDLYLRKGYEDGIRTVPDEDVVVQRGKRKDIPTTKVLAFHRRYVRDMEEEKDNNDEGRRLPKSKKTNRNKSSPLRRPKYETREFAGYKYRVSATPTKVLKDNEGVADLMMLVVVRELVLIQLEKLMLIQRLENRELIRKGGL